MNDTTFPEAKKAKVVAEDPVLAKVQAIMTAVQNVDFQIPGTPANREMLIAMAPAVLATASDVRHAHQHTVAETYKELFVNEEARLTQQVAEVEAKVTEAKGELATRQAAVTSAESALTQKNEELKDKQSEVAAKVHVTKDAESAFNSATSELTSLESLKESDAEEHQNITNLKTNSFLLLKEGSWEGDNVPKEHIKALQSFFRKKVDASMLAALPLALGRKPTDRSEFDNLAVSELEKALEATLQEMAQKMESNEAAVVSKKAEKDAAEAALGSAKVEQRTSTEDLLALKAQQKQLMADLSEKKKAVIEEEFMVKAVDADHSERKVGLEAHQGILSELTELLERCTPPAPEPTPEVAVEEEVAGVATVADVVLEPVQEAVTVA
jgi:chromosome segregation ATPase